MHFGSDICVGLFKWKLAEKWNPCANLNWCDILHLKSIPWRTVDDTIKVPVADFQEGEHLMPRGRDQVTVLCLCVAFWCAAKSAGCWNHCQTCDKRDYGKRKENASLMCKLFINCSNKYSTVCLDSLLKRRGCVMFWTVHDVLKQPLTSPLTVTDQSGFAITCSLKLHYQSMISISIKGGTPKHPLPSTSLDPCFHHSLQLYLSVTPFYILFHWTVHPLNSLPTYLSLCQHCLSLFSLCGVRFVNDVVYMKDEQFSAIMRTAETMQIDNHFISFCVTSQHLCCRYISITSML